jgi:wyosine [tRNA(Phe)-imidazoG37] synthetase (radical SAM superfamily)
LNENPVDLNTITRVDLDSISTVYGPVRSWRVGFSLGIDLLCRNSICSFNCTYCQLGSIQVKTNARQLFVPTAKVREDLESSDWRKADIITLSGSGEPSLATNMGEVIEAAGAFTSKPVLVLTNGTLLHLSSVRQELSLADRVYLKLDAASDESLRRVNRPVEGVTLTRIVENAREFRREYSGYFALQMMFVHSNRREVEEFAQLIERIRPDEVQVNTPTRPYPDGWYLASRGSHEGVDYPAKPLKPLDAEMLREIVNRLREACPGIKIVSRVNDSA